MSLLRISLTAIAVSGAYAHALTLPQAQSVMFGNNVDIKIAQSQVHAADARLSEALSAFHPSLNASASYLYQSEVQRMSIATDSQTISLGPGMTARVPGMNIDRAIGDHDRVDMGIDLGYPFFTGLARWRNLQAARYDEESQQQNVEAVRRQLSLQLGAMFFAWELSSKGVAVQDTLVNQLQDMVRQTGDRVHAGVAIPAQLAQAQARLAQAESDRVAAVNRADSLRLEIARLINSPDTLGAAEPYAYRIAADSSVKAAADRPEVRSLELTARRLAAQKAALLSRQLPSAGGSVGYHGGNPGLNLGSNEYMGYATAGVSASWNLYDGLKTRAQRRLIDASLESVDLQKRKLLASWETSLAQARLKIQGVQRQRAAADAALKAADAYAADCRRAVDAGTMTQTEYLDALTRRTQAQLMLDQCDFAEKTAMLLYEYAAGGELRF